MPSTTNLLDYLVGISLRFYCRDHCFRRCTLIAARGRKRRGASMPIEHALRGMPFQEVVKKFVEHVQSPPATQLRSAKPVDLIAAKP
jgi:hypothetical protein